MRIKVPMWLARASDRFHEWGYTPLVETRFGAIRRIDPLFVAGAIICTAYYWQFGGWKSGVTGLLAYIFVGMVALWIL